VVVIPPAAATCIGAEKDCRADTLGMHVGQKHVEYRRMLRFVYRSSLPGNSVIIRRSTQPQHGYPAPGTQRQGRVTKYV